MDVSFSDVTTLAELPADVLYDLAKTYLTGKEVLQLCRTSSRLRQIFCVDNPWNLWEYLYRRDLSDVIPQVEDEEGEDYLADYRQAMLAIDDLPPEKAILVAAQKGYEQLVRTYLRQLNYDPRIINETLVAAASGHHDYMFDGLEQLGATSFGPAFQALLEHTDTTRPHLRAARWLLQRIPYDHRYNQDLIHAAATGNRHEVIAAISRGATAFSPALSDAAEAGHTDVIKYILWFGGDNIPEDDLNEALFSAASRGHLESVQELVAADATDLDSALAGAALRGHRNIMEYLIDEGATNLNNALVNAALGGQRSIIEFLLDNGAQDLTRALEGAADGGHLDIIRYLQSRGAQATPRALELAVDQNRLTIIRELLSQGVPVTSEAIRIAATREYPAVLHMLVTAAPSNLDLNPALADAAYRGNLDLVNQLIQAGATDVTTALSRAAFDGHQDVVRALLRRDHVNPNPALESAAYGGHIDIIRDLLAAGATAVNPALIGAAIGDHLDAVKLLVSAGANNFDDVFETLQSGSIGSRPEIENYLHRIMP
jgi:ankyrin repeat protein